MQKDLVVKDLHELYEIMGLTLDPVDATSGFTIHFLQQTFKDFPFTSIPFRPNYFSFLFVHEAFGKYAIDDLQFTIQPGTVYFTNPGNYRIFDLLTETLEPMTLGYLPVNVLNLEAEQSGLVTLALVNLTPVSDSLSIFGVSNQRFPAQLIIWAFC